MKRALIASLVAAALATPASAAGNRLVRETFADLGELPAVFERQLLASAEEMKAHSEAMKRWSEDFSKEMRASLSTLYGPRMSSHAVVKGAPYSAEVITEANQMLADGNVISRKTVGAIYRDAEGRTRQETASDGSKGGAVYISDPIEGKSIVLMPGSKRAIVTSRTSLLGHAHPPVPPAPPAPPLPLGKMKEGGSAKQKYVYRADGTEVRIEDGKVFLDGKEVTGRVEVNAGGKEIRIDNGRVTINGKEVGPGHHPVVVRSIDETTTGDGTRREEVRVQVVRSGDGMTASLLPPEALAVPLVPPLPPMPGVQTMRFESTARLGKGTTTQLGAKDFDGVRAEGKSTVWVIPAGQIGNRNPIQVTSETWYSPDLKVTVYSRHHDPRTGESIYRLANIRRAEPAKDLFTIPEGYETKGRVTKREERREERK